MNCIAQSFCLQFNEQCIYFVYLFGKETCLLNSRECLCLKDDRSYVKNLENLIQRNYNPEDTVKIVMLANTIFFTVFLGDLLV